MKPYLLILLIVAAACNSNTLHEEEGGKETEFRSNDTIPKMRKTVSKEPVASYLVPWPDKLRDYKFGVKVYETPLTFRYVLQMYYDGMNVHDTLKIPNFGTWPVVQVKPVDKVTCIIGFLDKDKNFKEYKMLTAKGNKLKLKVLHSYYVGATRTPYSKEPE